MNKKRRSRAYDPNDKDQFIFVNGGKSAFVDMLPTDTVDEYGNRKVLIRNGELIGTLTAHGLWLKLHKYSSPALIAKNLTEACT